MAKKLLVVLLAFGLFTYVGIVPINADSFSASFDIGGAPTVIVDLPATSITPQASTLVDVRVNVDVSDAGASYTLDDLSQVTFKIWYDMSELATADLGTFNLVAANPATALVISWNGTAFTFNQGGGTTWVDGNSTAPTLTATSGDFHFKFKAGKIATETELGIWQIAASATIPIFPVGFGFDPQGSEMNLYTEISGLPESVNWGSVPSGLAFDDSAPSRKDLGGISVISNGAYALQLSTASLNWGTATMVTDTPNANNEFSILFDDDNTRAGAIALSASLQTLHAGGLTSETGFSYPSINFWLSLYSSFTTSTYSGTINIVAANQ